jgi:hypothetical protein
LTWFGSGAQFWLGLLVRGVPVRASGESPYGDTTNQEAAFALVSTVTLI